MDDEKFVARSAVFAVLRDASGAVLLHRRCNTGYMDGRYDLPSGHVERNEPLLHAAMRELQEETGISVREEALKLWHINQFNANNEDYYNFFFVANDWDGKPSIMEADKCDDMRFFALDELPKMTAGTHVALRRLQEPGVTLDYIDQAIYDQIAQR
jgi:8-oxo-dGTP diphosphatase